MIVKRAFTFIELLISIGIVFLVAGGVIMAMSRGASNVHRGSFNALAANQAAWIITLMRNDISRSTESQIVFKTDSGKLWKGSSDFKVVMSDKKQASYSVEKRGSGKAFVRSESGGRKQYLAAEYLDDISVEKVNGSFVIEMILKDSGKQAKDFAWNATVYIPAPEKADRFWKPLSSIK